MTKKNTASETFGQWLAVKRNAAGLSQREVATLLGFDSHSTIWAWEKDTRLPQLNPVQLGEYLKLLDVTWGEYKDRCS